MTVTAHVCMDAYIVCVLKHTLCCESMSVYTRTHTHTHTTATQLFFVSLHTHSLTRWTQRTESAVAF